ncbi:MAG: LemA family protein [Deltaproteobacteria bacterium]
MLIFISVVFIVFIYIIITYNTLIKAKNILKEAWSGIDVQLKRRFDLVPNLVETVKGYTSHEKQVLEEITQIRNQNISNENIQQISQSENQITDSLKKLFVVAEAYPELKASENFMNLHTALVKIEDELQMARRYYNGTVRDYNTKLQSFPNNLVAGTLKFTPEPFFEIELATQRTAPEVKI